MVRTLLFVILIFSSQSIAQQKTLNDIYGQWHETHGIEKFPCMNKKEEEYFTRLINVAHNDEKKKILADHRKTVTASKKSGGRVPASLTPAVMTKSTFICPPFRGVRNPHPEVRDFGKASLFERIRLLPAQMQVINGLSAKEKWPLTFNAQKGYYEGSTPRGTPTNVIPMIPPPGEKVRFLVQYVLFTDKTPPALTLCYREDLHLQCNPYAKPGSRQPASSPAVASPEATNGSTAPVKKVGG